jgi:hypothetical protein
MKERLDAAINNYNVVISISKKAQTLTKQDKKYVSEFNLPILGKKFKNYQNDIDEYFDSLGDVILEYAYLELFASFEAIVIEKIKLASGEMTRTLKANYSGSVPFISFEDRFVKNDDDFSSLNKILNLLENKIDAGLFEELKKMVKYRDKLAHGKRFHEDIVLESIEESKKIMEQILNEI